MNLIDYGLLSDVYRTNDTADYARVIAVHKERYDLVSCHGQCQAKLKASVYFNNCSEDYPTAGDFVEIQYNPMGDSLILKTLHRISKFSRNNFMGHAKGYAKTIKEQTVAANFDYVFIMQSLNHDFNPKRLERYLAQAWQSGATPVVILTKADLMDDYSEILAATSQIAVGVDVFVISAKTGYGLDSLSSYLTAGKTIVLLGSSGVGKSSFVNALANEDVMRVNEIRENDSKGKHTTTHRQLIRLGSGIMIIDTPGMRELGMWDVSEGLSEGFADVEDYFGKCKFSDCKHQSEPGCAIKLAIECGELSPERWESYKALKEENKFVEDKAANLREKKARNIAIKLSEQQLKKWKRNKL